MSQSALVFTGSDRGIIPWTLLGFIILSAAVHLLGFYIFQTIYPPAAHVAPPPAEVSVLTPGTPEADALLRRVNADDPSLIAQPSEAAIPGLMDLPYLPSYAAVHARPRIENPVPAPLPFPAGASGFDLVRLAAPRHAAETAPAEIAPTALTFSDSLRGHLAAAPETLAGLHAAEPGELQPARFLLGVSDGGTVRYVFLQDSSGDKALDAAAGSVLEQLPTKNLPGELTWGFATFYWGAAAYASAPGPADGTP